MKQAKYVLYDEKENMTLMIGHPVDVFSRAKTALRIKSMNYVRDLKIVNEQGKITYQRNGQMLSVIKSG